jgi:polyferredoxin
MRWFQGICQTFAVLIVNGHYNFFKTLSIYQGRLKNVCFPVLNCHSCPLALYTCPVGAIQHFIVTARFPVYVLSTIAIVGTAFGRMPCGLLCPFGYLQDLLYKLGSVRIEIPKYVLNVKYVILVMLVIVVPFYTSLPVFCKICPVAVLEAGFPLAFIEESVQGKLFNQETGMFTGWMFLLKTLFLTGVLLAAVRIKRPFCRILCPLGALLGIFNRFSIVGISVDQEKCTKCELCARMCPMDIDISSNPDSPECVRCMKCTSCEGVSLVLRLIPLPFQKNA